MFTLLVILVWIAIAFIYLLQYQIVRDYQPYRISYYRPETDTFYVEVDCEPVKYSIFDYNQIL